MAHNPIICALDTTDADKALKLAQSLEGCVGAIKLGLEFFTYNGVKGVRSLEKSGIPIFLDLKFHDIPNTVAGAIGALRDLNIFMTTVHTSGGREMMRKAALAIKDAFPCDNPPGVVGVTILTSLDKEDLGELGVSPDVERQVLKLALLAKDAGLSGVVCSPHEVEMLRQKLGEGFKLVVPGIRPSGSDKGDQKRTMTPKEALEKGADYLVIGRPITEAPDPAAAAMAIKVAIENACHPGSTP